MNGHRVALITGASAGIGREFARVFAEHDYDLVLVARRGKVLEGLAEEIRDDFGLGVHVIPIDLSKATAPKRIFEAIQKKGLHVDVLVNNAGIALTERFHESTYEDQMALVQVNVLALTGLTHLFMGPMVEHGWGRILNVASIVSFFPTPSFAAYGASKAFVLSLSESLSEELRGTGVRVTALCPGYTETEMIRTAVEKMGTESYDNLIPSFVKKEPIEVAREGYNACMKGKAVHVVPFFNDLAVRWIQLQPRWLVRAVGGFAARVAQ